MSAACSARWLSQNMNKLWFNAIPMEFYFAESLETMQNPTSLQACSCLLSVQPEESAQIGPSSGPGNLAYYLATPPVITVCALLVRDVEKT